MLLAAVNSYAKDHPNFIALLENDLHNNVKDS